MSVDGQTLEEVRTALHEALEKLEQCTAPAGIAAHIELALARLNAFLEMKQEWDRGNEDSG